MSQDTTIKIWEDEATTSNPFQTIPSIEEVCRAYPDSKILSDLKKVLTGGKVLIKLHGVPWIDFTLYSVDIDILKPPDYKKSESEALYFVKFTHSRLPDGIKFYRLQEEVHKKIKYNVWAVGEEDEPPLFLVYTAFYPYSFEFLNKYIKLRHKDILVDWSSIVKSK